MPDTRTVSSRPGTRSVVRVIGGATDGGGEEVTPTFTHTSTLTPAETPGVGRPTSQTGAQTVGKLVNNDPGVKVTIPVRLGLLVPEVHIAATVLTVRWGREVGIAKLAAHLSIGNDSVVFLTTSVEVVLLEVTRLLIESITKCGQLCAITHEEGRTYR